MKTLNALFCFKTFFCVISPLSSVIRSLDETGLFSNSFFLRGTVSVNIFPTSPSHNVSCTQSLLKIGNKIFHLRLLKFAAGLKIHFCGVILVAVSCTAWKPLFVQLLGNEWPGTGQAPLGMPPVPSATPAPPPPHGAALAPAEIAPAAPKRLSPPRKFFPFFGSFASLLYLFPWFGWHALSGI